MIIDFGNAYARKPEMKDLETIYAYRNDPAVFGSLGGHTTGLSREDVRAWVERHRTNQQDIVWAIADRETDHCVGHCGLYRIDYRIGKAETGVAIAQQSWGQGLGGRVFAGLTDFGFRQLRLHRIESYTLASNAKVAQIHKTLGYGEEALLRDFDFRNGEHVNMRLFAILRHEWAGIPPRYRPGDTPVESLSPGDRSS